MPDPPVCGQCGAHLASGAAEGLCPACLLKDGLALPNVATERAASPGEIAGTRIGPYKLLQRLGEGGMGSVWLAEQTEPIRRKVALKVIKPGMDSANVLARFEAERQALALMDHTHIARVFDAGTTEAGRPYFVMELVKGIPFTQYCDEQRLSIRERLELFIPVCEAIQHAHQKGIIHRDIKPSNVLVASYDGKPVPKVIDFGVAKAMGQQLTEKTLFTEFGAVIGTLEYMSPEQAGFNQLDIDTRSDIYSLGVLLYQLLTGSTPLSRDTLREKAWDEILRCIREQEPPRPSTRLSESQERLPTICAQRMLEPLQLTRRIRGDLDWIVMKALEKDRNRRYETASGLATDLRRHLQDEPVLAGPPTVRYRLQKFARKHRVAVAVSGGFVLLLTASTLVSTGLALWANRERTRAVQAQSREAAERARAVGAEAEAKENARKAKESDEESRAVLKFFEEKVLAATRPEGQDGGLGRDATIRAAIEASEPLIAQVLSAQPLIEARIRNTLGRTYLYLDASKAIRQLERALTLRKERLPPGHAAILQTMQHLGGAYRDADRLQDALSICQENLALCRTHLGPAATLTIAALNNLAVNYHELKRVDLALPLYQEVVQITQTNSGRDDPATLNAMGNLAAAYLSTASYSNAIALFEETLQLACARYGSNTLDTLHERNNLAEAYRRTGQPERAIPHCLLALRVAREKLGSHPITSTMINNLGITFALARRPAEALTLFEEAYSQSKTNSGPDHRDTLLWMDNLAKAYQAGGQMTNALQLFEEELVIRRSKRGPKDPETMATMSSLASVYVSTKRFSDAETVLKELLSAQRRTLPAASAALAGTLILLGESLLAQAKHADAEPVLSEAVAILEEKQPGLSPTFSAQSLLGWALLGQKKSKEAEPMLLQAYEGLKARDAKRPSPAHARPLTEAGERIVDLYETIGKPDEATKWRRKLADAKDSRQP